VNFETIYKASIIRKERLSMGWDGDRRKLKSIKICCL